MWANPWGGSFPFLQFQNVPHENVDWASLAKQWISQKEAADVHIQQQQQQLHHEALHRQGKFFAQLPPPPPPPPPDECEDGAPTEASLHSHHLISEPNRSPLCEKTADDENHMDISDDETGSIGRKEARNGFHSHNGPLLPTPQDPARCTVGWGDHWNPSDPSQVQAYAEYQPYPNTYKYSVEENYEGNPQYEGNSQYDGNFFGQDSYMEHQHQPFWPHHQTMDMSGVERQGFVHQVPLFGAGHSQHEPQHGAHGVGFAAHIAGAAPADEIDSAKRKKLPAWIRDGLEKMEREKQRQLEKEKEAQERMEAHILKEKAEKEALEELRLEREQNSGEAHLPGKSRFDSDDDDVDEDDDSERREARSSVQQSASDSVTHSPSSEQFLTEEEKQMAMVLRVKQWLTEILLDVTTQHIHTIVQETVVRARAETLKAPAKLLAKSPAMDSITSLAFGYGSGSSDDENSDMDNGGEDVSTSVTKTDSSKSAKTGKEDKIFSDEDSDYKPSDVQDEGQRRLKRSTPDGESVVCIKNTGVTSSALESLDVVKESKNCEESRDVEQEMKGDEVRRKGDIVTKKDKVVKSGDTIIKMSDRVTKRGDRKVYVEAEDKIRKKKKELSSSPTGSSSSSSSGSDDSSSSDSSCSEDSDSSCVQTKGVACRPTQEGHQTDERRRQLSIKRRVQEVCGARDSESRSSRPVTKAPPEKHEACYCSIDRNTVSKKHVQASSQQSSRKHYSAEHRHDVGQATSKNPSRVGERRGMVKRKRRSRRHKSSTSSSSDSDSSSSSSSLDVEQTSQKAAAYSPQIHLQHKTMKQARRRKEAVDEDKTRMKEATSRHCGGEDQSIHSPVRFAHCQGDFGETSSGDPHPRASGSTWSGDDRRGSSSNRTAQQVGMKLHKAGRHARSGSSGSDCYHGRHTLSNEYERPGYDRRHERSGKKSRREKSRSPLRSHSTRYR